MGEKQTTKKRAPVATILDQVDLTWYLSQGGAIFERSTIGAILEKLKNESCVTRKCKKCNGKGIVKTICRRTVTHTEIDQTSGEPKEVTTVHEYGLGDWCQKCNGTGYKAVRLSAEESRQAYSGEWSSSKDRDGARSAVEDEILVRYAHVSRMLSRMPLEYRLGIEAGYGDEGEAASNTKRGRVWACLPLTEAGEELLRDARERGLLIDGVTPWSQCEYLSALANLREKQRGAARTKLLELAINQATELLRKSEAVWDLTVGGLKRSECL